MQSSGNGMPQGMFGGWQLPQFAAPQQYAPSMADQNARMALAQQPPQQQQAPQSASGGLPGIDPAQMASFMSRMGGPAAPTTVNMPAQMAPAQPLVAGNGSMSLGHPIVAQPSQFQVSMPQIPGVGQNILSRFFGR